MDDRQRQMISELAEKYVLGKLRGEELIVFKELWANDDKGELKEAVQFHQSLKELTTEQEENELHTKFLQWIDEIETEPTIETPTIPKTHLRAIHKSSTSTSKTDFKKWHFILSIAAVLMIFLGIYTFSLPPTPSSTEIAKDFWSKEISDTRRGEYKKAAKEIYDLFDEGEYASAKKKIDNIPADSNFYSNKEMLLSIAHYGMNQADTTIYLLNQIASDKKNPISDEAKWRLALVYVLEKDYNAAKTELYELQQIQGYQSKSQKLLQSLPK